MQTQTTFTGTDPQADAFSQTLRNGIAGMMAVLERPSEDPLSLAILACSQLVTAYAQSEEYDGETDRSEIDEAYATAAKALRLICEGEERAERVTRVLGQLDKPEGHPNSLPLSA